MSLRARLAWTYGAAVFLIVTVLALVTLTAIDRSLRSSLDGRLLTTSQAATAIVDVHDGRLRLDQEDREQVLQALGGVMEVSIFQNDGAAYFSTAVPVPQEIARFAVGSSAGLFTIKRGDHDLRVAITIVQRGGVRYGAVAIWQGSDYIDDFDKLAVIVTALVALGIAGIVVVLSSALAQRALAPLDRFTAVATEIEAHDLSRRMGRAGEDELGRLGSAFDRMLDRLESAFMRQRRFTADASHELRAPLAVIRAEAEVALGRERTPDEYRQALQTIIDEVDRIDKLVDALLVAARAESSTLELESVDLGEIVSLAVERFAPAAASRSIELTCESAVATIAGDAQALERAIAALLHNALDFARLRVHVTVAHVAGEAIVTIVDDGPGFTGEGLEHATDRFWRGDPARRRGGTGLGLSIVGAIVRAHRGSLTLGNLPEGGARVTLAFPFITASSAVGRITP